MSRSPDACPRHRDLVEAAFGPEPADHLLERYAAEVPSCPDCRRMLGIRLGVHPGRLEVPAPTLDTLRGMAELYGALSTSHRPLDVLRARPAAWVGALLTAAAILVFVVRPPERRDLPPVAEASDAPSTALSAAPTTPSTEPVARLTPRTEPAPSVVRDDPQPMRPAPPVEATVPNDDWPAPAFVDLRGGAAKAAGVGVEHVELIPGATAPRVGGQITFTVAASSSTEVSLCVEGPERGVVWRGAVDAGSTPLVVGERALAYAFPVAGRYRFALTTDGASCADSAHSVWVEVR